MKKTVLNKFDEFILEKNINESILYLSPKFKNILNDINSKASQDILNMEGSDLDTNITLIDIDDDYEHLTFSKIENTYSELNSLANKNVNVNDYADYFMQKNAEKNKWNVWAWAIWSVWKNKNNIVSNTNNINTSKNQNPFSKKNTQVNTNIQQNKDSWDISDLYK